MRSRRKVEWWKESFGLLHVVLIVRRGWCAEGVNGAVYVCGGGTVPHLNIQNIQLGPKFIRHN